MKTTYKYISFIKYSQQKGIPNYKCHNNRNGNVIGLVEWYHIFKEYCYFPITGTVYSTECLIDITHFISQLNEQ